MARYQVIIAYDGKAFSGMQRQANERTVQGEVESALKKIGWKDQSIWVAGRTDTGVHASGQVVAFDLDWMHSLDDLKNALNANLPQDVAAQQVNQVGESFHPRFDAISRVYRYQIFCQPSRDPLRERFSWRVWPEVNLERLEDCAQHLVGKHDFSAFGTPPKEGGTTIRKIFRAAWQQDKDAFSFEVEGNAFLYHMVRRMVSIQVEIGQAKLESNRISSYLAQEEQEMVKGLAPPHGLCLTEVRYPEDVHMQSNLNNEE